MVKQRNSVCRISRKWESSRPKVRLAAGAVGALACVALLSAPSTQARVDSMSVVNVRKPTLATEMAHGVLRWQSPFRLPRGASSGHNWWYLINLRARFKQSVARPGRIEISSSVDGFAAVGIEVRFRSSKRCHGPEVAWSSLDLLRGVSKRWRCGKSVTVSSMNFSQIRAIRPGQGTLEVEAEGDVGRSDQLVVLPGSGLYRSTKGPAKLSFARLAPVEGLSVGSWARLPFRLANRGERPARGIHVSVASEPGLRVKPNRFSFGAIAPHEEGKGVLLIRPNHEGKYRLLLSARSTANSPGVEVSLSTREASSGNSSKKELALAAAVVCAAGLVGLRRFRAHGH